MKKLKWNIVAIMLAISCFFGGTMAEVYAAEELNTSVQALPCIVSPFGVESNSNVRATTFSDTEITVSCSSAGMDITIHTSMTKTASVVGVKDIKIDRLIGNTWYTVATANGGEVYNAVGCVVNFVYADAVYNSTYRIICTHYANVDGYRELYHETESMKFIY